MVDEKIDKDKVEISKYKKKLRMKQLWKFYKTGKWDAIAHTVTEEELYVLRKYYGADV